MTKYTLKLVKETEIIDSLEQTGILAWPSQALDRFFSRKKVPLDVYQEFWHSFHENGKQGIRPTKYQEWSIEIN